MPTPFPAVRRLAAIATCICLAGIGCGTVGVPAATELDDDFLFVFGGSLPFDLCEVWAAAWLGPALDYDDAAAEICGTLGAGKRPAAVDAEAARVLATSGAFAIDTLEVSGVVAGNKLPRWTAVLSQPPGVGGSGGDSVRASVAATDDEGNPARALPAKIKATLYDVDRKGKRKKAGKKTAKFDKKTGGAGVLFDELPGPRHHYEVAVLVKGRKVDGGGVSYAASTASSSSARAASITGKWTGTDDARAGTSPAVTWAGVGIGSVGSTAASDVPEATIVAYPAAASREAGREASFDIIGLAMQADANLDPPAQQVTTAMFTVYSVDAKGKRKKIATEAGKVATKNGTALVVIEGVPAPASHYEIDVAASGGGMKDSSMTFSALVTPAGAASRLAPRAKRRISRRR